MTTTAADLPLAPLTERQREVLEFIRDYIREKGYPPSVRDIGAGVNLASTSSVQAALDALIGAGYLRRDQRLPRALVLLDEPRP